MPDPTPTPQPGLFVPAALTPPVLPIAMVEQQIANGIMQNARKLYAALDILTTDFNAFWFPARQGKDAQGNLVTATPQGIANALKDAAGKAAAAAIVTGHGMLAPVAEQVRALYGDLASTPIPQAVPAAFTLTLNADGTVTVAPVPAPPAAPAA